MLGGVVVHPVDPTGLDDGAGVEEAHVVAGGDAGVFGGKAVRLRGAAGEDLGEAARLLDRRRRSRAIGRSTSWC